MTIFVQAISLQSAFVFFKTWSISSNSQTLPPFDDLKMQLTKPRESMKSTQRYHGPKRYAFQNSNEQSPSHLPMKDGKSWLMPHTCTCFDVLAGCIDNHSGQWNDRNNTIRLRTSISVACSCTLLLP